ncbi:holin [Streptococcus phage Sfi21]|jgi:phi LC3 family holin|uniref:Orf87 gp n=4 Tax=Moineauvirus TaxID=1623304 RepID=Q77RK3_9CAUD|nr:holin [Streptococcus phage Sfi19]NP_049984.1 holin [Streptococcus phage Sfi21]AAC39287.1 orf87 gp [Streptococcus phage Sfi21]AAC39301.1 orf87 gp [Streptococcus phage Sfi19]CAA64941.1 holin [Moineauvirus Sfi21]
MKKRKKKMINFKLRLQNKATLVALISAVFLMLQQFGLHVPNNIQEGINTLVGILVILGIITDPTTKGIADSERALSYIQPLDDKEVY